MDPASTSFILGYHGCDSRVAERVFSGKQSLLASKNDYDWLGDGIYFWEHNAQRAYEFACEVRQRRAAKRSTEKPAVVGAVIDLGLCLNLLDSRSVRLVAGAHAGLVQVSKKTGNPLPRNSVGEDLLMRRLDCAVIRFLHVTRQEQRRTSFDTVRAVFTEGGRLYENAGFAAKNHIQICVRNAACIKGYFRPLNEKGRPITFR